jgi:hypothetical protein
MKRVITKEAFTNTPEDALALLSGTIGRYLISPVHKVTLRRISGRTGENGTWRATVFVK